MRLWGRCILWVVACVFSSTGVASSSSPYRADIRGDVKNLSVLGDELQEGVERKFSPVRSFKPLRLSLQAPSLGRIQLVINEVSYKSWESKIQYRNRIASDAKDVLLVNGTIHTQKGQVHHVGGSIYRSKGHPHLFLVIDSQRATKRSAFLRVRLDKNQSVLEARISTLPESVIRGLDLHEDQSLRDVHQPVPSIENLESDDQVGAITGVAVVATDADPEYYAAYGEDTNAHIATLVNAASAIYKNNLGIKIVVGTQHVFTDLPSSPFTATDSGILLAQFKDYTLANGQLGSADAYHLFSGKIFDAGIVGKAFVGSICSNNDYSFGVIQKYKDASDASIFAHELGHNFGATHDLTDPMSLMAPTVRTPGSLYFSEASKSLIQHHLRTSETCLDPLPLNDPDPGAEPTPIPSVIPGETDETVPTTRLSVRANQNGNLDMKIVVERIQSGCTIELYGAVHESGEGRLLSSFTPKQVTTRVRIMGLKRPRIGDKSLYFWSSYVCSNGVEQSRVMEVDLSVANGQTDRRIGNILHAVNKAFNSLKARFLK